MKRVALALSIALFGCVLAAGVAAHRERPAPAACPCPPPCPCDPCACPKAGWYPGKLLLRPWRHPDRLRVPRKPRAPKCYGGPGEPEPQVDLPTELRMKNTGGSDGAGLCVYTSVTMAARFQGESRLYGLRKYAEKRPGGSWPAKLQKDLQAVAPDAPVLQVTGADLKFIRLCLDSGYMVSTTYGGGHMLNVVGMTDDQAAILDNNRPDRVQWMKRSLFFAKARMGGGIWIVVVLHKGPPPPTPVNALPEPAGSTPRTSGCDYRQAPGSGTRFTLFGAAIDRKAAEALVTRYQGKRRLTVVGDDALRKQVLTDWASAALAPFRANYCLQDYDEAHPLARGVGLAPGVTLQAAPGKDGKGKVLWRIRTYEGAAQLAAGLKLTEAAEALRRADPTYNPDADADVRQVPAPTPAPQPATPPGPPVVTLNHFPTATVLTGLGGVLMAVLAWFVGRRGGSPAGPAQPGPLVPVAPFLGLPGRPVLHLLFPGDPLAAELIGHALDALGKRVTQRARGAAAGMVADFLGDEAPAPAAPAGPRPVNP